MKHGKYEFLTIAAKYFGPILYATTPFLYIFLLCMIAYSSLNMAYIHTEGNWLLASGVSMLTVLLVWLFIKRVTYLVYKEGSLLSIGPTGAVLWLMLFIFSGYGLISFFVITEISPQLIADSARKASDLFLAVKGESHQLIYGGDYASFVEKIEGSRRSLNKEIFNVVPEKRHRDGRILTCGIGPVNSDEGARKILKDLERILPGYTTRRFLEEREHDCSKTENLKALENDILKDIDEQANKILAERFRVADRDKLFLDTATTVDTNVSKLKKIQKDIANSSAQFNLPLLLEARTTLQKAENEYQLMISNFDAFPILVPDSYRGKMDISSVKQIFSYAGIAQYIYQQLGINRSTFLTFVAAIYDFLVLGLLSHYATQWVKRRYRYKLISSLDDIQGTGVKFLLRPKV